MQHASAWLPTHAHVRVLGAERMREKDLSEKNLFALNDVFADFLNAFYRPKDAPKFLPAEFADAPTELISETGGGNFAHKFRDVLKCLRNEVGINLAFFGLENQTKPDKTMPVRVMGYDWLVYDNQLKQKTCTPQKLHPGMLKILPVVTIVLYFGYDERWNAPRSLSECFDVPAAIKPLFNDYPIHVIELAWLSDEEIGALSADLKFIAQSLRCFRNREFAFAPQGTMRHPGEVLTLLGHITGEPAYAVMKEKIQNEENADMCEIMEEFRAHYRAEGFNQGVVCGEERGKAEGIAEGIAIGEKRGEERGKAEGIAIGEKRGEKRGKFEGLREMTKRIMARMNTTPEDAMNYLQLTDDEKQWIRHAF